MFFHDMPPNSVSKAFGLFTEYATAAGHSHEGEVSGFNDKQGRQTQALHFRTISGTSYFAHIAPTAESGLITGHFSVLKDIQTNTADARLENYADTEIAYRNNENTSPHVMGARAILDGHEDSELTELRTRVHEIADTTDTIYGSRVSENDGLESFSIDRRVFPHSDDFTATRFNDAVETVTTLRNEAIRAVRDVVDLQIDDEESEGLDADQTPNEAERTSPAFR